MNPAPTKIIITKITLQTCRPIVKKLHCPYKRQIKGFHVLAGYQFLKLYDLMFWLAYTQKNINTKGSNE